MKIAILNKYQNKVNRGAETFVSELGKRLSKNHDVEIISDVNYLSLLKKKFDVVIPTNGRAQVFIVRIITWLMGSKMIISGQSGIGLDDRLNLYSFPDRFIGLTEYQSTWAKKINPLVKVETIPNGVDLNKFAIYNLQFTNKTKNIKTVLSVGAFTKEKRHELTIDAVAKLTNVKLIIIGGGGDRKQEIENYGLKVLGKDRFEILSVPFEKMSGFYKHADVLAFPTVKWESFGIVMVEAMASNLPVVATDDPIRREIVGDAGIFVDPEDTEAYSNALDKALSIDWGDKQSLAKFGFGKPRAQAEKFSWDVIAQKYEELFKELL